MCDCRTRVDENLKAHNARIAAGFTFATEGKRASMDLAPPMILLEKIDRKKRGKPPTLLATYCPFCGENYGDVALKARK